MSHKPRSLVRHAQHPVKLMRGHSFFGRTHAMDRKQPLIEGYMAIFKDGANGHGELLFAISALVQAKAGRLLAAFLRFDLPCLLPATMRTDNAIRPTLVL